MIQGLCLTPRPSMGASASVRVTSLLRKFMEDPSPTSKKIQNWSRGSEAPFEKQTDIPKNATDTLIYSGKSHDSSGKNIKNICHPHHVYADFSRALFNLIPSKERGGFISMRCFSKLQCECDDTGTLQRRYSSEIVRIAGDSANAKIAAWGLLSDWKVEIWKV